MIRWHYDLVPRKRRVSKHEEIKAGLRCRRLHSWDIHVVLRSIWGIQYPIQRASPMHLHPRYAKHVCWRRSSSGNVSSFRAFYRSTTLFLGPDTDARATVAHGHCSPPTYAVLDLQHFPHTSSALGYRRLGIGNGRDGVHWVELACTRDWEEFTRGGNMETLQINIHFPVHGHPS